MKLPWWILSILATQIVFGVGYLMFAVIANLWFVWIGFGFTTTILVFAVAIQLRIVDKVRKEERSKQLLKAVSCWLPPVN